MSFPKDDVDPEATLSLDSGPVIASLERAQKPYVLEQLQGPGAPRRFVLQLAEMIIGRSLQAHISVDSALLSRQHVQLVRSGPEYACKDLGSKNGFYVNGVRAHSAVLRDGDTLQLGDVVMVYREGE